MAYLCGFCGRPGGPDAFAHGWRCPSCGAPQADPGVYLPQNTLLGGFQLLAVLGRGGLGVVYLAAQMSPSRNVALKIYGPPIPSDHERALRFLDGVNAAFHLSHPNIANPLGIGYEGGLYFSFCRHVDGQSLEAILDRGRLFSEAETFRLAAKLGDALQLGWRGIGAAHEDVKPSNIVIDKSGEPVLLDFCAAKSLRELYLRPGQCVASPYFVSPEQARGEPPDALSDQYSLGVTMYCMLAGAPPFDSPQVEEILRMHAQAPLPHPRTRNPKATNIPSRAWEFLLRAMAKNPADRFPSWDEFIRTALLTAKSGPDTRMRSLYKVKSHAEAIPEPDAEAPPPTLGLPALSSPSARGTRQGGGHGATLVLAALLAVAAAAAAIWFNANASAQRLRAAEGAFRAAEEFYQANPSQYDEAIRHFNTALAISRGTAYEQQVADRFESVRDAIAKCRKADREAEAALQAARAMAALRNYDRAHALLKAQADARDPRIVKELDAALDDIRILKEQEEAARKEAAAEQLKAYEERLKAEAARAEEARAKAGEIDAARRQERAAAQLQERERLDALLSKALDAIDAGRPDEAARDLEAAAGEPGWGECKLLVAEASETVRAFLAAEPNMRKSFECDVDREIALPLNSGVAHVRVVNVADTHLSAIPQEAKFARKYKFSDITAEEKAARCGLKNARAKALYLFFCRKRNGESLRDVRTLDATGVFGSALRKKYIEGHP